MQSTLLTRRHGRSASSAHKDPCLHKNDNQQFHKPLEEMKPSPEDIAFHMSLDAGSLPIPDAGSVDINRQRIEMQQPRDTVLLYPESTFLLTDKCNSNNAFSGKAYSDPQKYMNKFGVTETTQTKPQIIFQGTQSPAPQLYGFNLFIDGVGNVRSKSSRESINPPNQEETSNKKTNHRAEMNNQVSELVLGTDLNLEELAPDMFLSKSKSDITAENKMNRSSILPPPMQSSTATLQKGYSDEEKAEFVDNFEMPNTKTLSLNDFKKVKNLDNGLGAYAKINLVKRSNSKLYALKKLNKEFLMREKKEYQVFAELEALRRLKNSPNSNIVKLYSCFETNDSIFFLMEYVNGGDFGTYLVNNKILPKEQIKFFTGEMINILEFMHTTGIAHRDFKPENILLKTDGHMKCIDFGTAKFLDHNKRTSELFGFPIVSEDDEIDSDEDSENIPRKTFNGTRYYVSPEVLECRDAGASVDLWALGAIIYQMATGEYAFSGTSYQIFEKIKNVQVNYPNYMDPEIKDLIQKLLIKDPKQRLGAGPKGSTNDYQALKSHPFLKGVNFAKLHIQKPPSGIKVTPTFEQSIHDFKFLSNDFENKSVYSPPSLSNSTIPEKVIMTDLVRKNLGWFFPMYKERQLILTQTKLAYYDPNTEQQKGQIPLRPNTFAYLGSKAKNKFYVQVTDRKYIFKEGEHLAEKWVDAINQIVAGLKAAAGNVKQGVRLCN